LKTGVMGAEVTCSMQIQTGHSIRAAVWFSFFLSFFFRRLISESLNGSQPKLDTYSLMTAV